MTAEEGYVWFLPVYVTLKINETIIMNSNVTCTASELRRALQGTMALSYATFGNDDDVLPTNQTVGEWKKDYKQRRNIVSLSPTDYAPYVYDAVWVYGKALIELIKQGKENSIFFH